MGSVGSLRSRISQLPADRIKHCPQQYTVRETNVNEQRCVMLVHARVENFGDNDRRWWRS